MTNALPQNKRTATNGLSQLQNPLQEILASAARSRQLATKRKDSEKAAPSPAINLHKPKSIIRKKMELEASSYIKLYDNIAAAQCLTHLAQKVLGIILSFASLKAGRCYASYAEIAKKAACNRRSVIRIVQTLQGLGAIRMTRRPRKNMESNLVNIIDPIASWKVPEPPKKKKSKIESEDEDQLEYDYVYLDEGSTLYTLVYTKNEQGDRILESIKPFDF